MLALALATTMCVWPTSGTTQAYAESTATTPSLSTYADNQALTDTTFAPNAEGTPNYVGTINFGKGADDNAASWYLLGGDGENVDVLAAVSLADDEAFQEKGLDGGMSAAGFTPDTDTWNDVIYVNGTKPSKVWWNNYGASDARVTLKKLATNTSKFASVEQDMMNTTTVETTDVMNKTTDGSAYLTYKTTDTLYLAATGKDVTQSSPYYPPLSNVPINVNNKTLNLAYYPGNYFYWLRTPNWSGSIQDYNLVFCAVPWKDDQYNEFEYGVWALGANIQSEMRAQMRPATNLNLSSVLFASAAPITSTDVAQTNIKDDTAMNLRFEATDATSITKNEIGSGFFSSDVITTTKGAGETVTLFVQGNDGENDWYYAKSLSSDTTTVKASDIGTDVDLTKCKIWLETTGSDGMTYAVNIYENFAVQFFVDGAEQTSLAQTVEKGSIATDPSSQLSKEGYTLDGWYSDESCTGNTFDFSTEIAENTKLYAKWVQNPFTVTFDSDGGSAVAEPTVKVEAGKTVAKPANPTREGFAFKYWALNGKEFNFETPITSDITLKAVWEEVVKPDPEPTPEPEPEARELKRIAGVDADETAAAISQEGFESSKYAIIARWDDFADAMSASGLAGTLNCPILLTRLDALSEVTAKELERLGAETVYVIGGTGAISEQIDKDLDGISTVKTHERIWGEYSWDTSLECAEAISAHDGNPNSEAIVAVSFNFQDALSISSYAYAYKVPLLLEDNSYGVAGTLTDSAVSYINDTDGTIWVAGGYVAVGRETVEGVFTDRDITRLWGWDGYDTSNQIATYMTENNLLSVDTVGIASGGQKANGVDALAGAALIGKQGGVMLLANANSDMEALNYVTIDAGKDSNGAASFLAENGSEVRDTYVLGGTVVAPETFFTKIGDILGIEEG